MIKKTFILSLILLLGLRLQAQDLKNNNQLFFLDAEGLKVWQVCQALSEFYKVNILVFDDIKEKPVYGSIQGISLEETLNSVSWMLGVEWIKRDSVYYVGGNASTVGVFDSAGIDAKVEAIFEGKVKVLNDKLIAVGTERDIKKIQDAMEKVVNRDFIKVSLYGMEVIYDKNIEIGLEWEKALKYTADWANILTHVHPVAVLSASLAASLKIEETFLQSQTLVNTELGIVSGSPVEINLGEDIDRPIYSTSSYGDRVVASYDTQHTGLIFKVKGYKQDKDWYFDIYIENSESKSDVRKTLTSLQNNLKISDNRPVLVGSLQKCSSQVNVKSGIPFLSDIPYLGYLFCVNQRVEVNRRVYFFMRLVNSSSPVDDAEKKIQKKISAQKNQTFKPCPADFD